MLTTLSFIVDDTNSNGQGRPSLRDLAAFNFQPQNIVANPNVLFYKADTVEHRNKLRSILPYVLGALSGETLAQRHELQRIQRELRRKEADLRNIQTLSERWRATIDARVSEAKDLGLIASDTAAPASQPAAMELLRGIASTFNSDPLVTAAAVSEGVTELNRLNSEEQGAALELSRLQERTAEQQQNSKPKLDWEKAKPRDLSEDDLLLIATGQHPAYPRCKCMLDHQSSLPRID